MPLSAADHHSNIPTVGTHKRSHKTTWTRNDLRRYRLRPQLLRIRAVEQWNPGRGKRPAPGKTIYDFINFKTQPGEQQSVKLKPRRQGDEVV